MSRRAGAIIAVLFVMVIGIVICSTVLATADAAGAGARSETGRTQSRALAWSGLQALMSELAEQRESLIDGQAPDVTPEWDLFVLDDGTRGSIRLIDLDPDTPAILEPENAKLDVNTATAEMLALVPGLDAGLAERIVAARSQHPFTSTGQLLGVEGITPELLYGRPQGDGSAEPDGLVAGFGDGDLPMDEAGAGSGGLAAYLTVFSFDPNVQVGVDDPGEYRGNLRVNLDQSWSEGLERAITERFDQSTANGVKSLMESGQSFATDSELVQVLIDNTLDVEAWPLVLDVFTTSDDEFLRGRVDINTATAAVLACVPGITAEQAGAIADARDGIDPAARRSPAWPVIEGILTPEEFVQAADWVTTRSTQWRVKIEAGLRRDDLGEFDESSPLTMDQLIASWEAPVDDTLEHRVVLEAVIDVGSSRPRVAYLREVTMLDAAMSMHRALNRQREDPALPEDPLAEFAAEAAPPDPSEPDPFFGDDPFLLEDPIRGSGPDVGLDVGSSTGGALDNRPESEDLEPPADTAGAEPRDPPEMIDRRIGRWTTRKAGDS